MALSPGTCVGPYEITALLGEGGMGRVWRAHHAALQRDAALKVIPDDLAGDPERLARFTREAQLLASLNHPHIAQVHGLEDAGGAMVLVMELVEGPTLADRIAEGPMPVDEALRLARQIADALEAAHAQGIVHRDLKPANIKITPDGTVKVLDFGLAKALEGEAASARAGLSQSPTVTTPVATRLGIILGTAAYMSPEQARGRPVDTRADVWAFGCVLYEMIAGRRAFGGEDAAEVLGAIIHTPPDWDAIGAHVPATVRLVLQRCLDKDPKRRLRDIGDVRLALDGAFETHAPAVAPVRSRPWRRVAAFTAAALVLSAVTAAGVWSMMRSEPDPRPAVRFEIPQGLVGAGFALSPDGRHMAYSLFGGGGSPGQLWVHSFETGGSRAVPRAGTTIGAPPFWSPDGRFVAYFGDGQLKRIDPWGGGGPPEVLATGGATGQVFFGPGSWSRHGIVVFQTASGLMRVPATGGTPSPVTVVDPAQGELEHLAPWFLPDGRRFLYFRRSDDASRTGIYAGDVDAAPDAQDLTRLMPAEQHVLYAPSATGGTGHLLFLRDGTLMARPFDPVRLAFTGEAARIADDVGSVGEFGYFAVSQTGVLAYRRPRVRNLSASAVWVSRTGEEGAPIAAGLDAPSSPRLAPDGSRLALTSGSDIWVHDVDGRPPIRLTFDGSARSNALLWSPDGRRIAYDAVESTAVVQGPRVVVGVMAVSADGSGGDPEPLSPPGHFEPHTWSASGREILLVDRRQRGTAGAPTADILAFSPQERGEPRVVVATPAHEGGRGAALSPDGRWLAYTSNETGRLEIWVRPFPGPGAPVRLSPNGGAEPVWARHGRELYYLERNQMMVVSIAPDPKFSFTPAALLFESRYRHGGPQSYDVAADGRFVMIKPEEELETAPPPLQVVINWTEMLPSEVNR
jgi:Tol biopolymer transport system component